VTDLRPRLAAVADALDELVPDLRDMGEVTESDAERAAYTEAARSAIRMAKQLRGIVHFVGHRSGRSDDSIYTGGSGGCPELPGLRVPRGSRPRARAATSDETGDHGRPR